MKKNFSPETIYRDQLSIDEAIKELYDDPTFDGIIDVDKYCKAPLKILWILKEVNDEGGYNQREAFQNITLATRKGWWRPLDPIIYISYAILNNFMTWKDLSYITDKPEMIEVLKQIAFINIKKEAGGPVSFDNILSSAYEKYRDVIGRQIKLANPDIIIGGNTLRYLWEDFGISNEQIKLVEGFNLNYVSNPDRLFINSYHPTYLMTKNSENDRGDYFNAIIQTAKIWHEN